MTDKEILQKFIEKILPKLDNNSDLIDILHILKKVPSTIKDFNIREIIFDPEFAKAYFGEELIWTTADEEYADYAWRVHQHQMLDEIQEGRNPLKYLEKFL